VSDPVSVSVQRTVNAPVNQVWSVATDLRALPQTMSGISKVEILAGGDPFGPGTRWRETRVVFGQEATEEMEVTAVDPYRSYRVEAENRGMHYDSTFVFEALGPQQTRVEMTFAGRALKKQNVFVRFFSRFAVGMVRKALEKDLEDLGKAAERSVPAG
jgi:uncharacterized membrane protein